MRKTILVLASIGSIVAIGTALATPPSGVVADTARGGLTEPLNLNRKFDGSGGRA